MLAPGRVKRCNAPARPLAISSPAGQEHAPVQHSKRNPGFSLVTIEGRFTFLPDWYRRDGVRDLALAYYFVLREALQELPKLRVHLVRCRHCRIFFLADPRNRGRTDLGCPFGCAQAHRKEQSSKRSTAYYRTRAGKVKRAQLNGRRRGAGASESELQEASEGPRKDEAGHCQETGPGEIPFPAGIVEHVRRVTSLIEGFAVSREEVWAMLQDAVRQHSILAEGRRAYVLRWLVKHPP